MFTLESIVKAFNFGSNSILKIDCEGCEYDVFNDTKDEILQRFEYIMIEYHHGINGLDARLSSLGFKVKVNYRNKGVGDITAIKDPKHNITVTSGDMASKYA